MSVNDELLKTGGFMGLMFYVFFSFSISLLIVIFTLYITNKYKIFSRLDTEVSEQNNISRLGGLAISLGFLLPFVIFSINNEVLNFNTSLFLSAFTVVVLTGFLDDIIDLNAKVKLVLHIAAGFLLSFAGFSITEINLPGFIHLEFGYFSHLITMGLVVLFVNAVNLIDGIDGLASGLVLIASFFILLMSIIIGNYFVTILSLIFIGSILGFMIFNFPPAKILMGDCGSYSLGFIYASIALLALKESGGNATFILYPIILLLIPLIDIMNVVLKRQSQGYSIFTPDRSHIHHRLLDQGLSKTGILYLIYSLTASLGLTSFLILFINELSIMVFIISIFVVIILDFILISAEKKENIHYSPRFNVVAQKPVAKE